MREDDNEDTVYGKNISMPLEGHHDDQHILEMATRIW